jgi:hypothetical protein
VRVKADWVARNDHDLFGQGVGDLVDHGLQHGKAQSEDDGFGATQRIAVVDGDDRGSIELRSQLSSRLIVGAREPKGLAA